MRIYLADLGHNQQTKSSDVYPLGIANLAAYVTEYSSVGDSLQITLFREPEDLKCALDNTMPDVLALSSYAWNHHLSLCFARYAKARDASVLTLMGGPNFPLTHGEQETMLKGMPEIDVAVRGPTYEGERAFQHIIERYAAVEHSIDALMEEPVCANAWIDRRTGELVHGGEIQRIHDLDEIPSPYLGGWLDQYFETGYFPLLQITRGCPFTCAFCNSAVKSNNKAHRHSTDNVKADLLYVAERIARETPLCLADDNFGMYPWDEEIADYIAYLQDRFQWPRYIRTTTGKNRAERIIRVMRKARGALPMTSAVQSLNPEVLENIKRSNINLHTYTAIQEEVRAQGMQAYGELILGLPGETRDSFMQSLRDLLATGVTRVSVHQLMLLHGAPLSSPESRQRFGFQTKFRVVARNIGDYTGERVIETEEVVVETPKLPFEDYIDIRIFHLLLTIFYYEGNFEEAFQFAKTAGIEPFCLVRTLQDRLDAAPKPFRDVIEGFTTESEKELFDTREECVEWTKQHWEAVVDGSLGGNLLSKYSMLGRFVTTHEALDFLEGGVEANLDPAVALLRKPELSAVIHYLKNVLLHSPFQQSLDATPAWTTQYDIEAWRESGYADYLRDFKFERPHRFTARIDPSRKTLIENRLRTFGEHPSGLGKFTRTMFAQDLRRTVVRDGANSP